MSGALYGVVSMINGAINILVHLAFLIVVMTAVRSRRPDASFPITMAAALFLLMSVMGSFVPIFLVRVAAMTGGAGGSFGGMSLYYFFSTIMSAIAWALLMLGLVKIASPPPEFSPNRPPGF